MKKFLLVVIALAMVSGGAFAQAKIKIGVAMAQFDDVWLTFVRNAITDWAAQHPDTQVVIVDAANDSAKQQGQIETFLAQDMDGIVNLPVDTAATKAVTDMVIKAKKALVYVNRQPSYFPKGLYYVGSNSIDSGIMNMEEVAKALKGKGNVAILEGELSNEAAIQRTAGIRQVIKKFPGIKEVSLQVGNWHRDEGKTITENWLASGQQIDAIASNNDEMALGALIAIKAAGKLGQIVVGGTDGSPDALASMDKGELNNTVFQDPVGQGVGAMDVVYAAIKKQMAKDKYGTVDAKGVLWIPYQKVTKDNYKSFMK